jgi:hypothetical protein
MFTTTLAPIQPSLTARRGTSVTNITRVTHAAWEWLGFEEVVLSLSGIDWRWKKSALASLEWLEKNKKLFFA